MPPEEIERIHNLETNVSLLQKDSQIMTTAIEKLTFTIERLATMVEATSKMVAVHDEKFNTQEKTNQSISIRIEDLRSEAIHEAQELKADFVAHEGRLMTGIDTVKSDLIKHIDTTSAAQQKVANPEPEKQNLLQTMINNWKYVAFGIAFAAGVFTHKWGLFTALFGIT